MKALPGVSDVFLGEDSAHLSVEAAERGQLLDSVVLHRLHVAVGVFADEGEVDDPDPAAVQEFGELRHDLASELVAGEAENQILDRADTHACLPSGPGI